MEGGGGVDLLLWFEMELRSADDEGHARQLMLIGASRVDVKAVQKLGNCVCSKTATQHSDTDTLLFYSTSYPLFL